jgi:hypothetical protein
MAEIDKILRAKKIMAD